MYQSLLRLKKAGKLTDAKIEKALKLGWITDAEADLLRK